MGRKQRLDEKLRYIVVHTAFPLIVIIVMQMAVMGIYAGRYTQITHNLNVSSKFNHEFKDNLDLKMYHYVVKSKEQQDLPVKDVNDALGIAYQLSATTKYGQSKKAIKNVTDYCVKLRKCMYEIEDTRGYDKRIQMLENNVYVLTGLIQTETMDYIYYEANYLSAMEKQMIHYIIFAMIVMLFIVGGVMLWSWHRASVFIHGITEPVYRLCENVREVGKGNFDISSVGSRDYEIAQLDRGIEHMAQRICGLLEHVKEEEKLQHMTQLQLLQAQINPHFLYNTLDAIVWMVEADMRDDAIKMLSNLSVFFRTALSKGEDVITLEEEIRHTRSYLDIQQVRYRDILQFSIDLPEELKSFRIPKLTLQPLVENALYHGVKEKRGIGHIVISCREEPEAICICVEDDGIGMDRTQLQRTRDGICRRDQGGFGLSAVQGRIVLYCGDNYGIKLFSDYQKGTRAEIRISKNIEPLS